VFHLSSLNGDEVYLLILMSSLDWFIRSELSLAEKCGFIVPNLSLQACPAEPEADI